MGKEIVAGRLGLKRLFRENFTRIIDDGKDTRSFLSFRKQKDVPIAPPWIYLFYGEECLGKSTAIHYCLSLGDEIASEVKKTVRTVVLDFDEQRFITGTIPATRLHLMEVLAEAFCSANSELSGSFSSYKKLAEQYRAASLLVADQLKNHRLNSLLAPAEADDPDETLESADTTLRTLLPKADYDIYESGETRLLDALVSGICAVAEEAICMLVIDGYRSLQPELEKWFRTDLLSKVARNKNQLLLFVGGDTPLLRDFRNEFPEDTLCAVNMADSVLTRHSIVQLASKRRVTLTDEQAIRLEQCSAGVPLIVHDILFHAGNGIAIDDLTSANVSQVTDVEKLASSILDRFNAYCKDAMIRDRVVTLAMLAMFNAKALAEIWNIPYSDVKIAIDALEKQTSFIRDQQIHGYLRTLLRKNLISEAAAARTAPSALKPLFEAYGASSTRIFSEALLQLQTAVSSAEKRCNDPRYVTAIEQLVCGMMWSSPEGAFILLPGYYLELLHFNLDAATALMKKMAEFKPLFTPANGKVFSYFVNGLALADKTLVFNRIAVKNSEEELIAFIESESELMTEFQRALFHHVKAQIDMRKNALTTAMEHLNNSFSLLGNSSPDKKFLYDDYVVLGQAFHTAGEHRKAIDTLSNAVLIKPDGFITWNSMGLSRVALNEHEGAINAFVEAVKIDPAHTGAWYSLGLSYVQEHLHENAVEALVKAAELSPERHDIWFLLANSFKELGQHADAIKAFRKVVLQQPENERAWILLGDSCSALGSADEAIEAYQKAVALVPDSIVPLKALGLEMFRLERFNEACEYLARATHLSANDIELWRLIARSHIGAKQYEQAVDAGNTALSINENDPGTLEIIGNAQMLREHVDEAVDMFCKSVEIEPDNAPVWQKLGAIYNSEGKPDLAIDAFKRAVAFDPSLKEVWYTIGRAYESQEQFIEAVDAYEKGVRMDSGNSDCWMHKGDMHIVLEQFEDAFECFSEVVKLEPPSYVAWFKRGLAALKATMTDDAVKSFNKVVELDKEHVEGWFYLGLSYLVINDQGGASRCFKEAVTLDDERTDVWYQLGLSLQNQSNYEEAVTAFEKCTQLAPDEEEYPARLGACNFYLNRFEAAYDAYVLAAGIAPENVETLFQLALAAHSCGKFEEAITQYRTITDKKPDHAEAWFNCALAYHAINELDKAIEVYELYIRKWTDNSAAYFNCGLAYHAKGELENAIANYRSAISIQQESPDVWYNLGIAFHTKEQFGDAIQAYRKVLVYKPDHIDAWFNLGMAYYIWQNYADAIDAYSKVVEFQPDHFTALGNIATAQFALGAYKEGLDAARKAFELKNDELWLIGNVIVGLLFTGDSVQAQEFTDRLLSADEDGTTFPQVVAHILEGLKKKPETSGAEMLIQKLQSAMNVVPVA